MFYVSQHLLDGCLVWQNIVSTISWEYCVPGLLLSSCYISRNIVCMCFGENFRTLLSSQHYCRQHCLLRTFFTPSERFPLYRTRKAHRKYVTAAPPTPSPPPTPVLCHLPRGGSSGKSIFLTLKSAAPGSPAVLVFLPPVVNEQRLHSNTHRALSAWLSYNWAYLCPRGVRWGRQLARSSI